MTEDSKATGPDEQEKAYAIPDDSSGWLLAERAGWHLLELQGEDVLILDMRGLSDVCDFFVLATGTSDVHVKALARHAQDKLFEMKERSRGVEGLGDGRWALLDFFDVIVHVFKADVREYYQLEKLWGDAQRLEVNHEWYGSPEVKERHSGLFPDDTPRP